MFTKEVIADYLINLWYLSENNPDVFKNAVEDYTGHLDLMCPRREFIGEVCKLFNKGNISLCGSSFQEFTLFKNKLINVIETLVRFPEFKFIQMNEGKAAERWAEVMEKYTDGKKDAVLLDGGELWEPEGICEFLKEKKSQIGTLENFMLISRTQMKGDLFNQAWVEVIAEGFSRDKDDSALWEAFKKKIIAKNSDVYKSALKIKEAFPEISIWLSLNQHIKCFICNKEDITLGSCNLKGYEENNSEDIMVQFRSKESVDAIKKIVRDIVNRPTTIRI